MRMTQLMSRMSWVTLGVRCLNGDFPGIGVKSSLWSGTDNACCSFCIPHDAVKNTEAMARCLQCCLTMSIICRQQRGKSGDVRWTEDNQMA